MDRPATPTIGSAISNAAKSAANTPAWVVPLVIAAIPATIAVLVFAALVLGGAAKYGAFGVLLLLALIGLSVFLFMRLKDA